MLTASVILLSCALMLALWSYEVRHNDAGIVDVGWSLGMGLAALLYFVCTGGDLLPRAAVAAVACPWSFRLAYYLLIDRVRGKSEDGRYQALRARWGANAHRNFLLFFQAQALLVVLFSLPFLFAMRHGAHPLFLALGVGWGWCAILGEAIADAQLRAWRANPANRGKTCRAGLWRYSRHPNYFFEWLHWWAYVLLCLPSPWAAAALMGPVLMGLFLFRVTGIPYTEAQALRSRGDDYRAYQAETSIFVPWFPRRSAP